MLLAVHHAQQRLLGSAHPDTVTRATAEALESRGLHRDVARAIVRALVQGTFAVQTAYAWMRLINSDGFDKGIVVPPMQSKGLLGFF